jgi:hypothetical protein
MSDAAAASDTVLTTDAAASTDAGAATATDATTAAATTTAADTVLTPDAPKPDDTPKPELTAEEKAAAEAQAKKDAETKGAPEEYTDFKLPDTFKVDAPVMGEFKTLAKELGLTQEAAQKLVDMQAKLQTGNATAFTETLQAHVEKTASEWATAAKADPEYGGAKFDENVAVAKQALDTFGTPELKALLKESRLGNHPEVIRFMFKAGKSISQDGFVPGRASSAAKNTADVLYGTSVK